MYTTYFSQVQLHYYRIMLRLSVLLYYHQTCEWSFTHYIAFQFYTLFFRPEWCASLCCTAVVRPQKGAPRNEPVTSSSNCCTTLHPSVFPLTLPTVESVVITFMNLQQLEFVGEYKCNQSAGCCRTSFRRLNVNASYFCPPLLCKVLCPSLSCAASSLSTSVWGAILLIPLGSAVISLDERDRIQVYTVEE